MKLWIYVWKFITWLTTLFASLVYSFHKHFKGIKTKRNIKYVKKGNFYQKLDVHYHKNSKDKKPCIIYFHGGGWTCYSKSIYTTLTRRLAKMGYVVYNANYSLAPKYKMDQILKDAMSIINFVVKSAENYGGDNQQLILAGDSAGAHISSMITALIKSGRVDASEFSSRIKGLVLLYGVYDINTMLDTGFQNIKTYGRASLYGKAKDTEENFKYSPVNYITSDYPPCFIASGKIDKLHKSQSAVFSEKLKEQGIKVEELFFDKKETRALHAYMVFDVLDTTQKTLKRIEKFLQGVTDVN